jgi:hypothetical protein
MLIPFGILSAAAGVEAVGDYELIESAILTSNESSVTFSNLGTYSSTYKHLQIRGLARKNATGSDRILTRFNSDSGSNYAFHELTGDGSSVSSAGATSQTYAYLSIMLRSDETANNFSPFVADILDPFSSTKNTTARSLTGNTASFNRVRLMSAVWLSTASITSISLTAQADSFVAGSRFSLYGVRG